MALWLYGNTETWERSLKVVSWVSAKGGAGKSSGALFLAVEAQRRGLIAAVFDLDPLASSTEWSDRRGNDDPVVTSIQVGRLKKALSVADQNGVELVYIDSAPQSSDATLAICDASDLILVPCRPAIFDLSAISTTARIIRGAGKEGYVVLNGLPHKAPNIERDARDAAGEHGLRVAPTSIHLWSSIRTAQLHGLTAQEYERDGKAAREIAALFDWTQSQISGKP